MTDVTIPAHDAKRMGEEFRALADDARTQTSHYDETSRTILRRWADLLDPRPPSLREQVAEALQDAYRPDALAPAVADVVLAVVADWLAAQPLTHPGYGPVPVQRDADVALIRGAMPEIPTKREWRVT